MGVITGEKVRLTGYRDDDIPIIIRWSENEELMRYLSVRPIAPDTEKSLRDWLESTYKSSGDFPFVCAPAGR